MCYYHRRAIRESADVSRAGFKTGEFTEHCVHNQQPAYHGTGEERLQHQTLSSTDAPGFYNWHWMTDDRMRIRLLSCNSYNVEPMSFWYRLLKRRTMISTMCNSLQMTKQRFNCPFGSLVRKSSRINHIGFYGGFQIQYSTWFCKIYVKYLLCLINVGKDKIFGIGHIMDYWFTYRAKQI